MTSNQKKKPFMNQFQKEIDNVRTNVKKIDTQIVFRVQQEIKDVKAELNFIDCRLEELNPEWCEVWRLRRRKQKAEQKLKRYQSYNP